MRHLMSPIGQVAHERRNEKRYRERNEHGVDGVARNARSTFGLLMFASEWVSEHISTQPERACSLKVNFSPTSNKSPRIGQG